RVVEHQEMVTLQGERDIADAPLAYRKLPRNGRFVSVWIANGETGDPDAVVLEFHTPVEPRIGDSGRWHGQRTVGDRDHPLGMRVAGRSRHLEIGLQAPRDVGDL